MITYNVKVEKVINNKERVSLTYVYLEFTEKEFEPIKNEIVRAITRKIKNDDHAS